MKSLCQNFTQNLLQHASYFTDTSTIFPPDWKTKCRAKPGPSQDEALDPSCVRNTADECQTKLRNPQPLRLFSI